MVLESIDEVEIAFNTLVKQLTLMEGSTVHCSWAKAGREYVEVYFQNWIKYSGLMHEITTAYRTERNGAM